MSIKIEHRTGRSVIFLSRQGLGTRLFLAILFAAIGTGIFLIMRSAGLNMDLSVIDIVSAVFSGSGGDSFWLAIMLLASLIFWHGSGLMLISIVLLLRGISGPKGFVFDDAAHRFAVLEWGENPFDNKFNISGQAGYDFSRIHDLGIREYTTIAGNGSSNASTRHFVVCLFKKDGSYFDLYHSYQEPDALAALATLQSQVDLNQSGAAEVLADRPAAGPVARWMAGRNLIYAWPSPSWWGLVLAAGLILGFFVLMLWQVPDNQVVVFRIVAGIILGFVSLLLFKAIRDGVISLFNVHALRLTDEKVEMGLIPKSSLPNAPHAKPLADPLQADRKFRVRKSLPVRELARVQFNYEHGKLPPYSLVLAGQSAVAAMAGISEARHLDFSGLINAGRAGIKDSLTIQLPGLRMSDMIHLEAMLESDIRDRGGKVL